MKNHNLRLFVLAGGFGTRLSAILPDTPKALAPVNNTPFLYHQVLNWKSKGIREFTFLLHHKADLIIDFLRNECYELLGDCDFNWIVEDEPLGTGGSISNAIKLLGFNSDFLVINADTWHGDDFTNLFISDTPAMAVKYVNDISRFGGIEIDDNGYIVSFYEKKSVNIKGWINAGLYKLKPNLFQNWFKPNFSLEREFIPHLLNYETIKAVPLDASFLDIGTPEDYNKFILTKR